jgi:hypothetical protein
MRIFYCAGDVCRYGKKSWHFLSSGERNGRSPNRAYHIACDTELQVIS